jgi:hypothetical protein
MQSPPNSFTDWLTDAVDVKFQLAKVFWSI